MFNMNCAVFASALLFGVSIAIKLPPFLTTCSSQLPLGELTKCITAQARIGQSYFAQGIPDYGLEQLDPLTLKDLTVNAGTFKIKNRNVVLKGLKNVHIEDVKWDLKKQTGHTKIRGNLTLTSDYNLDGVVVLIPIKADGKLTVKMYDTEIFLQYKYRTYKGSDGLEHYETYDLKPSEKFGNAKFHLTNLLGGGAVGDTVNKVFNDNWKDLMADAGPPFVKAISEKVVDTINKMYSKIPVEETFSP